MKRAAAGPLLGPLPPLHPRSRAACLPRKLDDLLVGALRDGLRSKVRKYVADEEDE